MPKANNIDDFIADSDFHTLSPPSLTSHYILWGTAAFFLIAFIWSYFAVLHEVTRGNGKVIPSGEVKMVQNLEGGIIRQILVEEGNLVEKDQVLMIVDDTNFIATYNESIAKQAALQVRIARLSAEAENKPLEFSQELKDKYPDFVKYETALYKSRQLELATRINTLNSELNQKQSELVGLKAKRKKLEADLVLIQKELDLTRPLLKDGAVSEVEIIRLERQLNDIKGDLDSAIIAIPGLEDAVNKAKSLIKEAETSFVAKAFEELSQTKATLVPLQETKKALADRVNRTQIRSPIKGIIKTLYVNTVGGVIQPGMNLAEIVPFEDKLLIQAEIKPSDIAFIHPGQDAVVKITAYDYSIYGGLPATVEFISADTIQNENKESFYEIRVRTKKNLLDKHGKPLPIIPGMMATVDILTGEKTVLQYLLKPILKAKQNALTER